jgi:flagellar basal-body rod modification protein FlgD
MSDIAPIASPRAPAQAGATGRSAGAEERRMISSDFETFLRMLTTQVENQDPLNPMNSTEFAVQLATFSGVEQQVKTNDLLGDMRASGLSQMASWVGMDARASVPTVYDGRAVTLEVTPADSAARAELVVRDETDRVWDRFDIDPQLGQVDWSGRRADGAPFAAGTYAFEVVSYGPGGEVLDRSVPEAYARVTEVTLGTEGPQVVFASGARVPATEVSGIRAP